MFSTSFCHLASRVDTHLCVQSSSDPAQVVWRDLERGEISLSNMKKIKIITTLHFSALGTTHQFGILNILTIILTIITIITRNMIFAVTREVRVKGKH